MAIKLLDCTLRDGGHQNKSKFGENTIHDIMNGLENSGVEYVEIGFLREENTGIDFAAADDITDFEMRFPQIAEWNHTCAAIMIQEDQYNVDKLPICNGTVRDIRVSFHDYDQKEGLEFCRKVIEKGYRCYVNPINITGYEDEQVLALVREVNDMGACAFTLVDTFGSLTKNDLQRLFMLVDHNLKPEIDMGIHLHDNLQMAFSLAQTAVELSSSDRNIILDCSLLGMGREPGNLCIELIMDYLNKKNGTSYDVDTALDLIDTYIFDLKRKYPWGYETSYALSAQYRLHRSYAEYLMKKQKLKTKQIRQILGMIPKEKRSRYDEAYIEKLYHDIVAVDVDDRDVCEMLKLVLEDRKVLLVAPGSSLNEYRNELSIFCREENPLIFSANFKSDFLNEDYVFCSNTKRLDKVRNAVPMDRLILSAALNTPEMKGACMVNTNRLGWFGNLFWDNCMLMLLHLMKDVGVKECYLAGWDGFAERGNFVDPGMESAYRYEDENGKVVEILQKYFSAVKLHFLTPSLYQKGLEG